MRSYHETFYLETIRELENRLRDGGGYNLVQASALLRKLFLDDHPLLDRVNRERRVPLRFEVCPVQHSALPDLGGAPIAHWINPGSSARAAPLSLKRDQFLAHVCAIIEGEKIAIIDVVRHAAYVLGGVHTGEPDKKHALILQIDGLLNTFGAIENMTALNALSGICECVIKALQPLTDEIRR